MDGSQKRLHVASGNTPKKPPDKKHREDAAESPARRSLGFKQRSSPLQKVFFFLL